MWRVPIFFFLAVVAAVGLVTLSSAQAGTLEHRYSFTAGLTDSVGTANGVANGDSGVLGGQAVLNLGVFGATRNGRIDLLANGANGININTYPSTTIEFWATPNCDNASLGCTPNPNDSFSTALGLGNTYTTAVTDGPIGAGADYIIVQTHRGDNASRGAISVTNETMGAPWGAETGVNGPELNDGGQHHYAVVINSSSLSWYVDGASMGTAALANPNSHGLANSLAGVSNDHVWIGSGYTIDQNWSGAMNELRIWKGAASSAYIASSNAAGPDQLTPFIDLPIPEPVSLQLGLLGFASVAVLRRKARH